jgi:hypothetical protein
MSVGFMSSFCTPLGAMYILSSWRMLVPPPVPVTWRQLHVSHGLSYDIFFARHSLRGLVVPSLGCRTLRRVCKCGWPDGWHHPSARVPRHLQYSSPFQPCRVLLESFFKFFKDREYFTSQNDGSNAGFTPPPPHVVRALATPPCVPLVRHKQSLTTSMS